MFKRIAGCLIAVAAATLPIHAGPGAREITIDCDSGGNLQRAVNHLARRGGGTVNFTGTCRGVSVTSPFIEIVGESVATSQIDGGTGRAVSASGPGHLEIRNARLIGNQVVFATGTGRVVFVRDCELEAEFIGVHVNSDAGVLVADSVVSGGQYAVRAIDSSAVVERSVLRDTAFGARVFESVLALVDVEVSSTGSIGVQALDRSTVTIDRGSFSENGNSHLSVQNGSHLESLDTRIGGPEDTTHVALQAGSRAYVGLYAGDSSAEIWGGANVVNDAYVNMDGATLRGSMQLEGFSRLLLNGNVTLGVACRTGADASCDFAATATTSGCNSAPASCLPLASHASPQTPQLRARPGLERVTATTSR